MPEKTESKITISISDNGIGIAPEDLQESLIFQKFLQQKAQQEKQEQV